MRTSSWRRWYQGQAREVTSELEFEKWEISSLPEKVAILCQGEQSMSRHGGCFKLAFQRGWA